MSDKTYGYIKKRVLCALDECADYSSYVSVSDTERDVIVSRIPDAVNSALIRMYKSLPIGQKKASFMPFRPDAVVYRKRIEKEEYSFDTDKKNVAAVFDFCGSGSVEITDKSGNVCSLEVCEGDGRIMRKAYFCTLSEGGYTVKVHGFLALFDFTVYEACENVEIDAYAPCGWASIELPEDFSECEEVLSCGLREDKSLVYDGGKYAYFCLGNCGAGNTLDIKYRIKPPFITSDTAEDFTLELPDIAIEALICLTAGELCKEGDSVRYTRLIYKYTDLCEGLRVSEGGGRNSFFKNFRKKRW